MFNYQVKDKSKKDKLKKLNKASSLTEDTKFVKSEDIVKLLEIIISPYDKVCLEGNNQKQANFLAKGLVKVNPKIINNLHMVQSVLALPEHLDLFEKGIAKKVDFAYSGPQGARLARLVANNKIQIGDIHTYLELYGRYFIDLTPNVSLVAAQAADRKGNLYTGPNTEDTPLIVEATAFKLGIVLAQVNEIVDELPRVDIPSDWIDFIVLSPQANVIEPLFTRDPALITDVQILIAMIALKGIYAEYEVKTLNHGIGFNTAAIELLLPTYAKSLNLKDKICLNWALNPHPTMIPAIEAGFAKTIYSFGSEVGMDKYIKANQDIFFTGLDGTMRSNRAFGQTAGMYACDMFIGSTLQIDLEGNSSTATLERIAGFGGAPNLGSDSKGRRHITKTWLKAGKEVKNKSNTMPRGRKLVVQLVETFRGGMEEVFVKRLDAWDLAKRLKLEIPPVMIYGEDLTHIVTEEGLANLLLCENKNEVEQAIRGVAGFTEVGLNKDKVMYEKLRKRKVIQTPEDLGIDKGLANRNLLSARSIKDLVISSKGLYEPPKRFISW